MRRKHDYAQHFLRDPNLVKELIGHTKIKKHDTVLDIGAGSGVITSVLAKRVKNVISIEYDKNTFELLRKNTRSYTNIEYSNKDVMSAVLPSMPYKVFSNIPFHLSSAIVRKLVEGPNRPTSIYLIVQKQFARKLLIGSKFFTGLLGAQIAPYYRAKIRRTLRKTDFWPHPNVDTVFIELILYETPYLSWEHKHTYEAWVERCFNEVMYYKKQFKDNSSAPKASEMDRDQWIKLFKSTIYFSKQK